MTRNIVFRDGKIQKETMVTNRFVASEMIKQLPALDDEL
jgi:hypothetical protein